MATAARAPRSSTARSRSPARCFRSRRPPTTEGLRRGPAGPLRRSVLLDDAERGRAGVGLGDPPARAARRDLDGVAALAQRAAHLRVVHAPAVAAALAGDAEQPADEVVAAVPEPPVEADADHARPRRQAHLDEHAL